MAKPAFIYAFDNLGPERFVELCGLLLASRYKGFLLGGAGPDGGIDAELDEVLGEWQPEAVSPLFNEVIQPNRLVVFQFKHEVTARLGQTRARAQLLRFYKCQPRKKCELHRNLVVKKKPNAYVLVTNVEVNSEFRTKFIKQCRSESPNIEHYQIIGLDELETWVTTEVELRHIYFPTIFGEPRYNLRIRFSLGFATLANRLGLDMGTAVDMFSVEVLNVGVATSYVSSVGFVAIVDGERKPLFVLNLGDLTSAVNLGNTIMGLNPKPGTAVEPGQKLAYNFPAKHLGELIKGQGSDVFLAEVIVSDEIGNSYNEPIPEQFRDLIMS